MKSGFIKISREILSWKWYQNLHTKGLYLYLLMNTAWKPYKDAVTQKFVDRGQCLISIRQTAEKTGMTRKAICCALDHLEATGEITRFSDRLATLITVQKYNAFQSTAAEGYIKLPRWHPSWNWFENLRASMMYLHLILSAAYADTDGLKRGQVFTRLSTLSAATGQTERAVRTDLSILEQAGLIRTSSGNRGRTITVIYYDLFAGKVTGRMTGQADEKRQAESEKVTGTRGQQVTGQLSFTNGLDKASSDPVKLDRGTPSDKQKGTPDVKKGDTDCHSKGTRQGTASIIKESIKNGRREENAPAGVQKSVALSAQFSSTAISSGTPAFTAKEIISLYRRHCSDLQPLTLPLSRMQYRRISELTQAFSRRDIVLLFEKAGQSDFLSGRSRIGWKAGLDWIIQPDHARRILAGTYDKLWHDKSAAPCKTADDHTPTYDLQEYVDLSIHWLLKEGTSRKVM